MARNQSNQREENNQALAVVQPPRLPYPANEAGALGVSPGQWKALVDAVFPSAKSVDGVMLAINYAKARGLDVFKRVVHVVPMYNSALGREVETVWPGVGELRTTASRTGAHAGNDDCVFGPEKKQKFHDKQTRFKGQGSSRESYVVEETSKEMVFPEWAQFTVYKMVQGQRVAFVGPKVRFVETFSGTKGLEVPNARWQRAPYQMLEKCAEAAALRRAFPEELGDQWSAEEMEGKDFAGITVDADYRVIPEEGKPAAEQKQPTRETSEEDKRAEELARYWGSGMSDFMDYMEQGFSSVRTAAAIDKALNAEAEGVSMLPPEERAKLDGWVAAARERVKTSDKAAKPDPEPDPAAEEKEEPSDQVRFGTYIETLERYASEAATVVDVNSLKAREKQTIADHLPPNFQEEATLVLDVAMMAAKTAGDFRAMLQEARARRGGASEQDQSTTTEKEQ